MIEVGNWGERDGKRWIGGVAWVPPPQGMRSPQGWKRLPQFAESVRDDRTFVGRQDAESEEHSLEPVLYVVREVVAAWAAAAVLGLDRIARKRELGSRKPEIHLGLLVVIEWRTEIKQSGLGEEEGWRRLMCRWCVRGLGRRDGKMPGGCSHF